MPGKIPKTEERHLDETGFNFVRRCIEVLESRGMYEVAAFLCHVIGTVNAIKLYAFLSMFNQQSHVVLLKRS
jgi:hypothetical protein